MAVKWLPNSIIEPILEQVKQIPRIHNDKCNIQLEEIKDMQRYLENAIQIDDQKKIEKMKTFNNYDTPQKSTIKILCPMI